MKTFAYFLPQFHCIPENNQWWGEGFTEWTNIKSANRYYHNHIQPIHPLNDNYYNLLNKSVVEWQTKLMDDYGIDGMIYYHYYFCGKKLLEKPAENLLKWKDIDQKFFFCWANHTWKKTWNGTSEILVEQNYGGLNEWEEHFQYLLPFFNDIRYEKKEGKPLFMIFLPDFQEKNDMITYFDNRCKEEGFGGIYIINTITNTNEKNDVERNKNSSVSQICHSRQPSCAMYGYAKRSNRKWFDLKNRIVNKWHTIIGDLKILRFDARKLFKIMIDDLRLYDESIPGLFFAWDNTPRHGDRGHVINGLEKEYFFEYMDKIKNSEYVFINAWNEWCEGMILEPTVEYGYRYLEWIKEWKEYNEEK